MAILTVERDPSTITEFERFQQLIGLHRLEKCVIDGVRFWVNPQGYSVRTEALYTEVATAGGYGFFDFGVKPYEISLSGWTGAGGRFWLDNPAKMRKFRPQHGQPNEEVDVVYAIRFKSPLRARVLSFTDSLDNRHPFAYTYQLELKIYPPQQPSYSKLPSSLTASNLLIPVVPGSNQNPPTGGG